MFGTTQSEIKVWDISKQCFSTEFRTKSSHPIVTDVCHHSSTNVAAVSSIKKTAWDLATTYKTRNDTSSNHSLSSVQLWRVDHRDLSHELISDDSNGCVTKIVMNNNGTSLVTGSTDGIVRIYDIQTHTKIHSFNAHMDGGGVGGLIYRNDSILVTCGRKDGNILDLLFLLFLLSSSSNFFINTTTILCNYKIRDLLKGPKVVRRYTGATMNNKNDVYHNYHLDMRYNSSSTYLLTGSNHGNIFQVIFCFIFYIFTNFCMLSTFMI
jgi:WD40 repeat protein